LNRPQSDVSVCDASQFKNETAPHFAYPTKPARGSGSRRHVDRPARRPRSFCAANNWDADYGAWLFYLGELDSAEARPPGCSGFIKLRLTPVSVFSIGLGLFYLAWELTEREYAAQGLQLAQGCNAAAANQAEFDLYAIDDRLAELTNAPDVDTKVVVQLRAARVVAEAAVRFTNDDCRRRGHRDSHPWKTNWTAVKIALEAADRAQFGTNSFIQR
jgi:hypothetical protein